MTENETLAGALLTPDTVNATDYPISAVDIYDIERRQPDAVPCDGVVRPHIVLQQCDLAPYGNVSCFYTAAFACAADAWELTADERKKALAAWRDGWAAIVRDGKVKPGFGGRLADGVDYSRRAWNAAFPEKRVRSFRGSVDTVAFYRALSLGWKVQIGRFVGKDELSDILDDGIVQDDVKEAKDYGHSTGYYSKNCSIDLVQDNSPKNPLPWKNTYQLDDLETKVKNGVVFPSFYVFLRA